MSITCYKNKLPQHASHTVYKIPFYKFEMSYWSGPCFIQQKIESLPSIDGSVTSLSTTSRLFTKVILCWSAMLTIKQQWKKQSLPTACMLKQLDCCNFYTGTEKKPFLLVQCKYENEYSYIYLGDHFPIPQKKDIWLSITMSGHCYTSALYIHVIVVPTRLYIAHIS